MPPKSDKKPKTKVPLKNRLIKHVGAFKEGDAVEYGPWKIGIIVSDRELPVGDRKYDHTVFIPIRRGPRGKPVLVRKTSLNKLPSHIGKSYMN